VHCFIAKDFIKFGSRKQFEEKDFVAGVGITFNISPHLFER